MGFGLVAMLVFLLGAYALIQVSAMEDDAEKVDQQLLPTIQLLGQVNQEFLTIRAATLRLLISEPAEIRKGADTLGGLRKALARERQELDRLIDGAEGKALLASFDQSLTRYENYQQQIIELALQGRVNDAIEITKGELNGHASSTSQSIHSLIDLNRKAADAASDHALEVAAGAFQGVVVAMVLAFVARNIHVIGSDEPARLLTALQAMQQSLRETIQGISDSSNQLASAAEELNVVTEDSTRGLHQQNHEIEQAATAVNEMTTAVDEVARNAVATSEASRESDETAQHGRQQVIRTVDSIGLLAGDVTQTASEVERLAGQVRDISKVLDVIRSIAEQTNLLALNAAIEAARAGDAGRGFAVVADEVRALAHRTQQSTQEIEQMIGDVHLGTDKAVHAMQLSNERARSTLELARAAGEALDGIATAISQISERNLVIASASEEQAQVAREVDRNLVNIRDLSLQSSAGANQTSAASQELARLAIDLNSLVARFQV